MFTVMLFVSGIYDKLVLKNFIFLLRTSKNWMSLIFLYFFSISRRYLRTTLHAIIIFVPFWSNVLPFFHAWFFNIVLVNLVIFAVCLDCITVIVDTNFEENLIFFYVFLPYGIPVLHKSSF